MPRAARRPCRQPLCSEYAQGPTSSYCTRHQKTERQLQDRDRPSAAKRGYAGRWPALRKLQLAREPLCRHCKAEGRDREATEVDHIVPLAQGGTHRKSNLQSLCKAHHSAKTNTEDGGFGRPRRERP